MNDPIQVLLVQLADGSPSGEAAPGVAGLFGALLSATTDAVLVSDPTETIALANERAERMFGVAPGELRGVPLGALLPADGDQRVARQLDGTTFAVESVARSAPGGWVVHTLRDRADDVGQSDRELRIQLLHLASHELREPLRIVRSYAELLDRRLAGIDPRDRALLDHLTRAARRLLRMNDDLQAYVELDRPLSGVRPIDLGAVVRQVLADLGPQIVEAGADVRVDPLPTMNVEPVRVSLVFRHLLENALQFARPGEAPAVHVSAAPAEGGGWEVTVRDEGVGIEPQYTSRLFLPFQRLHPRGESGGSGLGLAICRRAVEAHGGAIRVTSTPGRGAEFRFTLPERRAER